MRKASVWQIYKVFELVLGAVMLVSILVIFFKLTSSTASCKPNAQLFDNKYSAFSSNFLDDVNDNICGVVLDANSVIWTVYSHFLTSWVGVNSEIEALSIDLWGLGKYFCKTKSNVDYVDSVINNGDDFIELFKYELERCWKLMEGYDSSSSLPKENRNPLGKKGIFDCAELVYDFTINNEKGVTINELNAAISEKNACYEKIYSPSLSYIKWCVPRDKMIPFNGTELKYGVDKCYDYKEFDFKGDDFCFPAGFAACMLGEIDGYNYNNEEGIIDDSVVIDGRGKITISYFDDFDWGGYIFRQKGQDNYPACGGISVVNSYKSLGISSSSVSYLSSLFKEGTPEEKMMREILYSGSIKNNIVICYEKYD